MKDFILLKNSIDTTYLNFFSIFFKKRRSNILEGKGKVSIFAPAFPMKGGAEKKGSSSFREKRDL